MRSAFLYIATFLFMTGLCILVMARIFERDLDVLTYVCAGYFIVTGLAMAVLLSCFEYSVGPARVPNERPPDQEPLTRRSENEEEPLETV